LKVVSATQGKDIQRSPTQEQGHLAEQQALVYLIAEGLTCVDQNVRYKVGELDLIMRDGATTVFVEVRARRSSAFGGAAASVTAAKQRRMSRAAQWYLLTRYGQQNWPRCRFDVIAIDGGTINWIKDAFGT
jgi:putative endonuclease